MTLTTSTALFLAPLLVQGSEGGDCSGGVLGLEIDGGGTQPALRTPHGPPVVGGPFSLSVEQAPPNGAGLLLVGPFEIQLPVPGYLGHLVVGPPASLVAFPVDAAGSSPELFGLGQVPALLCGVEVVAQALVTDPSAPGGATFTNGQRIRVGEQQGPLFHALLLQGTTQWGVNDTVAGDFDEDGILDIAAMVGGDFYTYSGDGAGGFSTPQVVDLFDPSGLDFPFDSGDFNGDGHVDFAVFSENSGEYVILDGDGTGTFVRSFEDVSGDDADYIAIHDIDLDGDLDIVVANGGPGVSGLNILRGAGDGTFSVDPGALSMLGLDDVVVTDLTGDGWPDLVAPGSNSGRALVVWAGIDGLTFEAPVEHDLDFAASAVQTADLNLDGIPDFVLSGGEFATEMAVVLGTPAGVPGTPAILDMPYGGPGESVIDDFDLDGFPDFAVPSWQEDVVATFLGAGDGTFASPVPVTVASGPRTIASGDWNGDGRPDLVTGSNVDAAIAFGIGDGSFAFLPPLIELSPAGTTSGDLNGDGVLDLLAWIHSSGGAPSDVVALLGDGQGGFAVGGVTTMSDHVNIAVLNDWSGDGVLDLAVPLVGASAVGVRPGNGDGTFGAEVAYPTPFPIFHHALVAADVNVDGRVDLLTWSSVPDRIIILPALPGGTFDTALDVVVPGPSTQSVAALRAADVNDDTLPDLLFVTNGIGAEMSVFSMIGNGDTTFEEAVVADFSFVGDAGDLFTSDLNLDGFLDIVVPTTDNGVVLAGDGTGSFVKRGELLGELGEDLVDVDGDGAADLLLRTHDRRFGVRRGVPGQFSFEHVEYFAVHAGEVTDAFSHLHAADVDGDGCVDAVAALAAGVLVHRNLLGEAVIE